MDVSHVSSERGSSMKRLNQKKSGQKNLLGL